MRSDGSVRRASDWLIIRRDGASGHPIIMSHYQDPILFCCYPIVWEIPVLQVSKCNNPLLPGEVWCGWLAIMSTWHELSLLLWDHVCKWVISNACMYGLPRFSLCTFTGCSCLVIYGNSWFHPPHVIGQPNPGFIPHSDTQITVALCIVLWFIFILTSTYLQICWIGIDCKAHL